MRTLAGLHRRPRGHHVLPPRLCLSGSAALWSSCPPGSPWLLPAERKLGPLAEGAGLLKLVSEGFPGEGPGGGCGQVGCVPGEPSGKERGVRPGGPAAGASTSAAGETGGCGARASGGLEWPLLVHRGLQPLPVVTTGGLFSFSLVWR